MSGTFIIDDDRLWMPANWMCNNVLEMLAAKIEATDARLADAFRCGVTLENIGVVDLRGESIDVLRSVQVAAKEALNDIIAEGSAAFAEPEFYPGFVARLRELCEMLEAVVETKHRDRYWAGLAHFRRSGSHA